jgi:hypothetical protein
MEFNNKRLEFLVVFFSSFFDASPDVFPRLPRESRRTVRETLHFGFETRECYAVTRKEWRPDPRSCLLRAWKS